MFLLISWSVAIRRLPGALWQVAVGCFRHPAAAPLSALLRIGGKRKPGATEGSGASRDRKLGCGDGGRRFLSTYPTQLRGLDEVPGGSQQLGQLGDVSGDARAKDFSPDEVRKSHPRSLARVNGIF